MKKTFFSLLYLFLAITLLTACYIPRSGFYTNKNGTRYFVKDVYRTGWQEIDGKTYYFSLVDGYMVTESRSILGVWYGFNEDGTLLSGFHSEGDITRYYIDGIYQTSWQEIDGKTYYFYIKDGNMATGETTILGRTYLFSDSGELISEKQ